MKRLAIMEQFVAIFFVRSDCIGNSGVVSRIFRKINADFICGKEQIDIDSIIVCFHDA